MLPAAAALVVLLVPLGLLIQSTQNASENWAAGSSAGRLFTHIRESVPHAVLDLVVLAGAVGVVAVILIARRRHEIGAAFARHWPVLFTGCWLVVPVTAVVMLSLVDRPVFVVRYLMVSLPPALMLVAVAIVRGSPLAGRRATAIAASLLILVVTASLAGVTQWYSLGASQDFRSAIRTLQVAHSRVTACSCSRPTNACPSSGIWQAGRPSVGRPSRLPGDGVGRGPLRFDLSVPMSADAVERAASKYGHIWFLSVTTDQRLYPVEAGSVEGVLRRQASLPRVPGPSGASTSPRKCGGEASAPRNERRRCRACGFGRGRLTCFIRRGCGLTLP